MKSFLFFFVLLTSSISFSQKGVTSCHPDLIGTWAYTDAYGQMVLTMNADGSCEMDGFPMSYSCADQKLFFTTNGQVETWAYAIDASGLSLSDLNSGLTVKMTRKAGGQAEVKIQSKPNETPQPVNTNQNNKQLIGVWVGHNEKIEFKENGICIYNDLSLNYVTSSTTLTLSSQGGSVIFNYTLLKDELTLQADGKTLNYQREGAQGNKSIQSNGTKRIAQELVGKWCWTNVTSTNSGGSTSETCIVLNADGTYTYNSERSMDTNTEAFFAGTSSQSNDFGTWTYDGSRIYYTSQNGQGTGSYKLEKKNHPKNGDPMILLDGEAYVTYFQKNPW